MFFSFALGRLLGKPQVCFANIVNRPYRFWCKFYILPVGEGSPLPRMTIPPSFSCENATSLYTREAFFWFSFYYLVSSFLIVGDDVLGVPFIKNHCVLRGQSGTPAPTGLCDICYFGCRGDHWSSVIYKGIILFKKDRRGRRSLQV